MFLISVCVLYTYSQYTNKQFVSAILQNQIDINNPPETISAIAAYDQKLPGGKDLPKGTKFIGMLSRETNSTLIYFDTIEFLDGKQEQVLAKTSLNIQLPENSQGLSGKIGKTFYKQTKSNVLGAIFYTSMGSQNNLPLQQGSILKIEIN